MSETTIWKLFHTFCAWFREDINPKFARKPRPRGISVPIGASKGYLLGNPLEVLRLASLYVFITFSSSDFLIDIVYTYPMRH